MTADLFDLPQARPVSRAPAPPVSLAEGAVLLPGLALSDAPALLAAIHAIALITPFSRMETPGGRLMSVAMTACGEYGWCSDRNGYRYTTTSPLTGEPWLPIPDIFVTVVRRATAAAGYPEPPLQSCLINRYEPGARLSLHQDRDEDAPHMPIVSISLGVAAIFLWGGLHRSDPVRRLRLTHGDVVVWGGPSRFVFHGIAPLARSSHPNTGDCRFNLTFRQIRA
ncbi:DNA oxidative demethylase AlkB [Acetobacter oeni]|uniref:Alpha-ketoglutarate-dependent dioxygenase AlkB n=1 Tax=Acetobacter oeni TaxID=304077 RepID=A0A511XHV4_9PROT|nr:DNA oxidative demethylase AlkB [Acetobacter oeni]MBB3882539.1 alkylated DNA repair protein (DNA oxidative demethylase) [Acetobacter oeni]NHO18649.1 DNA oxidative demethylase AlkB [Acetobacter oeni]GBR11897.1 DNA repair protein for alkylated DNA [Acetobacter oeni LMG 21952]GEN62524.1 alpha-ketoglutarate-dependent dioxygenase AlkB [Acetobacter oeni]